MNYERHLFWGTHQENMADMVSKGRQGSGDRSGMRKYPESCSRGESHYHAKATEHMVRMILALGSESLLFPEKSRNGLIESIRRKVPDATLLTRQAISLILRRKNWKHIEEYRSFADVAKDRLGEAVAVTAPAV